MPIRIQLSRATVKDLHSRLQHAYQRDDVRLVRRTTVLLDLLVHHMSVEVLSARWGLSASCIYGWRQDFLLHGVESLLYHHGGGRHKFSVQIFQHNRKLSHSTEFSGGACQSLIESRPR